MIPSPIVTRTCNRPTTRPGRPCRAILQWYETACAIHATAAEQRQALDNLRQAQNGQT